MAQPQKSAAAQKAAESPTKVVTTKVRLSYVHVWKPTKMNEQSEPKYSVSVIIPKDDKELIAKLNKAIEAAKQQGLEGKWGGKLPPKLKMPLRDGDVERPDDKAYENSWFISASSKQKPQIVNRKIEEILDESEVYSGMYAKVSLNFFAFNTAGSKGVACGLNSIQKIEDGEALGGRSNPEDDFEVEGEEEDLT